MNDEQISNQDRWLDVVIAVLSVLSVILLVVLLASPGLKDEEETAPEVAVAPRSAPADAPVETATAEEPARMSVKPVATRLSIESQKEILRIIRGN